MTMTIKLKVGKRYVRRDGEITGPLEIIKCGPYTFRDSGSILMFNDTGEAEPGFRISQFDLLRGYRAKWRVVVECDTRAHAREWASQFRAETLFMENTGVKSVTVEKSP